jgi:putative nucleotidyltransferase with HDIG domain
VTATLALTIGKKFNWFTFDNQEKVYLGSMLHDLGYKDEKNAFHELMDKDEIEKLDPNKRDDILNHTTRYNEQLTKTNLHQDVINIIIRHHGAQGAGSYPRNVSPHEATLIFALFMISHDFTLRLFKASFNKNKIPEIINDMESTYKVGNYKTIYPEFVKSVKETFLDVN